MSGPIDLFLVAGQSNAQGRAPDNTLSPDTTPGMAFEATAGRTIVQLADPVGNADTGSAWPAFTNALTAESGVPCAIAAAAVGGTELLQEYDDGTLNWSPTGTLFDTSVTRINNAVTDLTGAGWTPAIRGVLWSQGEYDGMWGDADPDLQSKYQAALIDLFDRYKTALSLPDLRFYVFRTGKQGLSGNGYVAGFTAVRNAQDAACAATAGMEMVFTGAVDFAAQGYMADGFHYTQQGYNLMGTSGGNAVAVNLGYYTPPPDPDPSPVVRSSVLARRLLGL